MSLLLDALNRASKEKAAAAGAVAVPATAVPLPSNELELEARARPDVPDASPAPDWPNLALSPEPELVVPELAVVTPAIEVPVPAPSPDPAPVEPPPVVQAPEAIPLRSVPAPEVTLATAVAPAVAAAAAPEVPAQTAAPRANPARVAQEIQRAKAAVPVKRPSRRLIALGGVAGVLALALGLSSVLLGWWGDPTAWFVPPSQSALVPATPMAVSNPVAEDSPAATDADPATVVVAEKPADPPLAEAMVTKVQAPKPSKQVHSAFKEERVEAPSKPVATQEAKGAAKKEVASIQRRSTGPTSLELGYDALTQGRLKEATQAYTQALASNPEERDALLGLAYIAHQQSRDDEAGAYYSRVLRQDPGNAVAQAGLIALGAQAGSPDSASRARDVAEQNPKSAAAQVMLGHSLVQENRMADAQQAFYQAHLLEPAVASHAFNLAVALDRMRSYVPARRYYEMALTLSAQSGGERASNVPHAAVQTRLEQLRRPGVADSQSTLPQ